MANVEAKASKYDNAFFGILQNEGDLGNFLDAFFSFLYRRTDFYLDLEKTEGKMGFAPGMAQKVVVAAYMKYERLAKKRDKMMQEREQLKSAGSDNMAGKVPPVAHVEEVTTDQSQSHSHSQSQNTTPPGVTAATPPAVRNTTQARTNTEGTPAPVKTHLVRGGTGKTDTMQATGKAGKTDTNTRHCNKDRDERDNSDSEQTRLQQNYQSHPESYNGAIREKYSWSQSITDIDIRVQVPGHIKKGREVQVAIEKKRVRVWHRDESGQWQVVVDGALSWEIHKEESMWSLVPGDHVHVNLEKIQERWWEALLVGEDKISVRKIDASRPVTDLEDEAQCKIEEMMYNQLQKERGLPQSNEQVMHQMLRKAWDAKGSPFKGQQFDPSKLNISGPGSNMMNLDPK